MYVLIFLLLVFIFVLLISLYMVSRTIYPKTKTHKSTFQHEIEQGSFTKEYFDNLQKEEIKINSGSGYNINSLYFPCAGSKLLVVIAHGFSYTLFGSIKYVKMFHEMGISALVYDHRYHGLSGGKNTTFGYREKEDLKTILDYVYERFGDNIIVGTHGESLGGATVLMHGAMDHRVNFIISDCAFSSLKAEISYRIKQDNKLPAFPFVYLASFITGIITGAFYSRVSPAGTAGKIKSPVMIIHGKQDDYTPYEHGLEIYSNLKCSKHFYGAEGAGHAKSIMTDTSRYTNEVKQFLRDNNIL